MQFYVLGDLRTDDWAYAADVYALKPKNQGDALRCPVCNEFVSGLPWLPPYRAEIILQGQRFGDVLKVSGTSRLVSDRFRHAWQEQGLRGIDEFSPVDRIRVRPARLGRRPLTYYYIEAHYRGVSLNLDQCLIDYTRGGTCNHCHGGIIESIRRLAIDESSWGGEDLFIAWGDPGSIIVTDRVRQMRDKYELTNMNLTPVEEFLWDPLKKWTPYCHYLPDGVTLPESSENESSEGSS